MGMHAQPNVHLLNMWRDRLIEAGYSEAAQDLVAAAADSQPDVREVALGLLGLSGHQEALSTVRRHLDDPYPPARIEAARSAALLGDEVGIARLRAALELDWPDVALNAAAYLADLGEPAGFPELARALTSSAEALRLQAALLVRSFTPFQGRAISGATIDVPGALEHAALDDPSPLVRREAVYQAAHLPAEDRARILGRACEDPDPGVATAARNRLDGPVT